MMFCEKQLFEVMNNEREIKNFLEKNYGIKAISLSRIKQGVINSNYLVDIGRPEFLLFKIYNLRKSKQVVFELELFEHLKKNNFSSPRVIKNNKGALFSLFKGIPCVLLNYIPGRVLDKITLDILYKIGVKLGALHNLLRDYNQTTEREMRDPEHIRDCVKNDSRKIVENKFPEADELLEFLDKELGKLDFPDNLPVGITHQDVKPENIILGDGDEISFIDFDYAYRGVLLYDMMTTVIWTCFENYKLDRARLESFIAGYEKSRIMAETEKNFLDDALRFRLLREAFIWPWLLLPHEIAKSKSDYFIKLYRNLKRDANILMHANDANKI